MADGESTAIGIREDVPKPEAPAIDKQLDQLLKNPGRLRWLVFLLQEYTSRLRPAQILCMRVMSYRRTCYLLDFDVIRNFLEVDSLNRHDSLVVDYLFLQSKTDFAIPTGAFLELLDYLAPFSEARHELRKLTTDFDRHEAIRVISGALGVVHTEDMAQDQMISAIIENLSQTMVELSRLLMLLKSDRFKGIRSGYDPRCYSAWLRAIQACPRPGHGLRSEVDQRDAANLAIASERPPFPASSETEARRSDPDVCYVLVSQTAVVVDMLRRVEDPSALAALTSYFNADRMYLAQMQPAVYPTDAMVVEMLGGLDRPLDTLKHLKGRLHRLQITEDGALEEYIRQVSGPNQAAGDDLETYIDEQRDMLREQLRLVSAESLDAASEVRLLEDKRATIASEEEARLRQLGKPEDVVKSQTLRFVRLLGEVAEALELTRGLRYTAMVEQQKNLAPFATITIRADIPGDRNQGVLLNGELYASTMSPVGPKRWEYYSLQWPITCLEEQLTVALRNTLTIRTISSKARAKTTRLIVVNETHAFWREGLIVSTPLCNLGMSLTDAMDNCSWKWIDLRNLGSLVREAFRDVPKRDGLCTPPPITQLRINTRLADIIYDVVHVDTVPRRYLTVVSHVNLSNQIAELYRNTGTLFCMPRNLAAVLQECLQGFVEPAAVLDRELTKS